MQSEILTSFLHHNEGSHQVPVSASGAPPSPPSSAMNKRKRGKPQRALSSTVVPLAPSNVMLGSPSSLPFIDHAGIEEKKELF